MVGKEAVSTTTTAKVAAVATTKSSSVNTVNVATLDRIPNAWNWMSMPRRGLQTGLPTGNLDGVGSKGSLSSRHQAKLTFLK
jgi:hypothetical protein